MVSDSPDGTGQGAEAPQHGAHDRKKDAKTAAPDPVAEGVAALSRRLRVLEERYTVLRRKGQLSDENLIQTEKEVREKLDGLSEEITQLHRVLADLDDKLDMFLEQVKRAAPREEVLTLRKYIELWDPVRYLTREEAQRLLAKHKES